MNIEKVKRFAELTARRRQLKSEDKALMEEIECLEPEVIKMLADAGIPSVSVDVLDEYGKKTGAKRTIRIDRVIHASAGGNMQRLVEAMKADGLDEMVGESVHGGRLSAWVREFEKEVGKDLSEEELCALLPPNVREAIKVSETFKLGMTTST